MAKSNFKQIFTKKHSSHEQDSLYTNLNINTLDHPKFMQDHKFSSQDHYKRPQATQVMLKPPSHVSTS